MKQYPSSLALSSHFLRIQKKLVGFVPVGRFFGGVE
jgi:hypothetical protein